MAASSTLSRFDSAAGGAAPAAAATRRDHAKATRTPLPSSPGLEAGGVSATTRPQQTRCGRFSSREGERRGGLRSAAIMKNVASSVHLSLSGLAYASAFQGPRRVHRAGHQRGRKTKAAARRRCSARARLL